MRSVINRLLLVLFVLLVAWSVVVFVRGTPSTSCVWKPNGACYKHGD